MLLRLLLLCLLFCIPSLKGQNDPLKLVFDGNFKVPNTSIRAIETDGGSGLWFAGSNGKYGKINQGILRVDSLSFNDKNPSFRALAINHGQVFALSIENPALLFRLVDPEKKEKPELVYKEQHPEVFYDSMTFLNSKDGIAMGDPIGGCLSILITTDGGTTWRKKPCSELPETADGEAAFAASDSNIASWGDSIWIATGGSRARIFRSQDKGASWEVFSTPVQQGKSMTGIYSVDFSDEMTGIVMGGNWEDKKDQTSTKALTKDGGETWTTLSQDKEPGYISCVQYIPGTLGQEVMATSTEGIFYSDDEGHSWKKLSDQGFFSLRFENRESVWLSRQNEIVHASLVRQ